MVGRSLSRGWWGLQNAVWRRSLDKPNTAHCHHRSKNGDKLHAGPSPMTWKNPWHHPIFGQRVMNMSAAGEKWTIISKWTPTFTAREQLSIWAVHWTGSGSDEKWIYLLELQENHAPPEPDALPIAIGDDTIIGWVRGAVLRVANKGKTPDGAMPPNTATLPRRVKSSYLQPLPQALA